MSTNRKCTSLFINVTKRSYCLSQINIGILLYFKVYIQSSFIISYHIGLIGLMLILNLFNIYPKRKLIQVKYQFEP